MSLTRSRKHSTGAGEPTAGQPHPYWAADWTIGPAKVPASSKIFLWCAGVDRALLRTGAEVLRYSGLGALVIAVAALGATTFTIFSIVVIGHFHWYLIPFGLLWGTVILLIDRAIVTEPHYRERTASKSFSTEERSATDTVAWAGNGTNGSNGSAAGHGGATRPALTMEVPPDRAGWALRGLVYALRILITACIAYLVAEAAMLLIFHPEVTAEVAQLHVAQFQQAEAKDLAKAQTDLGSLHSAWTSAQQQVATQQTLVKNDIAQAAAEESGRSSGPLGPTSGMAGTGSTYQQDLGKIQADEKTLTRLQNDATQDEQQYDTLKSELQGADQGNLKDLQAFHLTDVREGINSDNGLNEQEHAFSLFVQANQGDVLATAGPWVLRVLLIAIDLVPLSTKLLNRYTIYGRRMSERALIIRYHDVSRDNAIMRDIDHQAAIHALRSQHDYEVDAERAGWRRSWRMNYMRFPE